MVIVDYAESFWGDKHIGYHILYDNLKKGEETCQELGSFVKERISLEDELLRFLNKSLTRVNTYVANNGAFAESWRLTKGTLELWSEIQTSVIKNLSDLSKDVGKYHDDLVKSRKRVKEQDVIDAVNIMQTTTTCLQKAKETFSQRCAEVLNLKNENASSKELIKAKSKLVKAHEELKAYVDKYETVRVNFEEKMLKATRAFQAHDQAHLQQMKNFFVHLAKSLDDCHSAVSQVTTDYKRSMENIDIEDIMVRFVEERGTGTERPQPMKWNTTDEIPAEFDVVSQLTGSAASSSNSSAIISSFQPDHSTPTVNDLLTLDNWGPQTSDSKSPADSDSENGGAAAYANGSQSYMPQFSSWLGRQKLSHWRKKQSSQSNLPSSTSENLGDFSSSYNEGGAITSKGSFLKRYRKAKNSVNDLTLISDTKEPTFLDDSRSTTSSCKSDEKATWGFAAAAGNGVNAALGIPPPLPTSEPPPLPGALKMPEVDAEGFSIPKARDVLDRRWSSCSSSSDEEEENSFQTSKIKALQIKPLNAGGKETKASVDELRNAIGHISLQRSSTFDKDPWSERQSPFSQSLNTSLKPMRAAYTGDEHLRKKLSDFDSAPFDFSQSTSAAAFAGSAIARARPRSRTPTADLAGSQFTGSTLSNNSSATNIRDSESMNGTNEKLKSDSVGSLSNMNCFNDSTFGYSSPVQSALTAKDSAIISVSKLPVAMAINEYVHVWLNPTTTQVRVFGTVVISFPSTVIRRLIEANAELEPFKFSLQNASQIKNLLPNKKLVVVSDINIPSENYQFVIDKASLSKWLSEQLTAKPTATFHNVDILRYELVETFQPPLFLTGYWKVDPAQTDLRIDYRLNTEDGTIENALLNVVFNTQITGGAILFNSDPSAKWNAENSTLSWNLTELTKHGECSGSLKARLKLSEGPSVPSNTFVQFQILDVILSKTSINLDSTNCYGLSLIRRKVHSGKYFCEPEVHKST